jgi:hypothetical protein
MKFILLFLFVPFSAFALSIDEIRMLAVNHSAALSAREIETHALSTESDVKGRWQNPQLMGQFGTLKSGPYNGATIEVSFTQAVPLSNKFSLRKEIAEVAASQQQKQTEFYRNWVGQEAVLSAWKVFTTRELYKHGLERKKRLALVKKYLETSPRATVKQRVEHSLIGSILMNLERDLDLKDHDRRLALSDLEFWTGKKIADDELDLTLPDYEKIVSPQVKNTHSDIELKEAELKAKMSALDKEMAAKERRPDLYVGGGYRVENVTPVNHFSYGTLGLYIPIWDTGSVRAQTASARLRRDEKNLEEIRRKVALKHEKQVEVVKYFLSQVKRFPPSIVKSTDRTIHEAEMGFRQGVLDVNTFLQTETQSHEIIDQVYLSWMSYLENLSALALMRGEELQVEKK